MNNILLFIISFLQVTFYNVAHWILVNVPDYVLRLYSPVWVACVRKTSDSDLSDSEEEDEDTTTCYRKLRSVFDMRGKLSAVNASTDLDFSFSDLMCLRFATVIDILDGNVKIVQSITYKLRMMIWLKRNVNVNDIITLTKSQGRFIILFYEFKDGYVKEQVIDLHLKKEVLTDSNILFGLIEW